MCSVFKTVPAKLCFLSLESFKAMPWDRHPIQLKFPLMILPLSRAETLTTISTPIKQFVPPQLFSQNQASWTSWDGHRVRHLIVSASNHPSSSIRTWTRLIFFIENWCFATVRFIFNMSKPLINTSYPCVSCLHKFFTKHQWFHCPFTQASASIRCFLFLQYWHHSCCSENMS